MEDFNLNGVERFMASFNVPIKCPQCGGDQFECPAGRPKSTDRYTCVKCGRVTSNGQAVKAAGEKGLKMIADALKKAFK